MRTIRRKPGSMDIMPRSELLLDGETRPAVLRAYAIADAIRALVNTGAVDWQTEHRDAVADELNLPALFIDAAANGARPDPRVSLDLLEDYREWRAKYLDAGKAVA